MTTRMSENDLGEIEIENEAEGQILKSSGKIVSLQLKLSVASIYNGLDLL